MRKLLLLIPLTLLLTFCASASPAQPDPAIAAMVNATLTAVAQNPGGSSQASSGGMGSIAGQLNYPAGAMPALKVFALLNGSDQFYEVDTAAGQMNYQIDNLPEGKYHVVAYTAESNGTQSGAYTQAVLCGLSEACTDHSLADVVVFGGETAADINVFDWLQPNFPPMPGSAQAGVVQTVSEGVGAVSGTLMFPADALPPMKVVAFNIETGNTYSVETAAGQNTYQLDNLPSGRYFIVAYSIEGNGFTGGVAGGYTSAVLCGLSADCTDHTLLEVNVIANALVQNIVPGDFYAPEGTFPAQP